MLDVLGARERDSEKGKSRESQEKQGQVLLDIAGLAGARLSQKGAEVARLMKNQAKVLQSQSETMRWLGTFLESQWPIIWGYFQSIVGYFGA